MKRSVNKTLQDAQAQPWRHGFMSLMRLLAAAQPELPPVGKAQRPQQENFRLAQQASLGFAVREVAVVEPTSADAQGRTRISLFGLGMLGPNGPLPLHMTEIVRERVEAKRDKTLANFLDIFHHRAFTHIYRSWSQSQSAIGLDRASNETFTPYVARLAGDEPDEVQHSALPAHARWASSAHRVRTARNPDGLVSTLSRFFGVTVDLHEYQLQWMPIESEDQCRIGVPRLSSILGEGALVGEVVPDRQTRFRLIIGPLSLDGYLRLTPQGSPTGKDLPALIEFVRAFVGFEYVWEVELLICAAAAPAAKLGEGTQLGWTSWLGNTTSNQVAISGMLFEPELYATSASS